MHNYKELKVWQKSVDLAVVVYKVTSDLPKEEKYGLTSQMNCAVISVSSNIAERASRASNKDFANFLRIALGSAFKLESQLTLSEKLGLIQENQLNEISSKNSDVQKMIHNLVKSLAA